MWARLESTFNASAAGRWFAALERRERTIVGVLAVCVVFTILFLGLWSPLTEWSARADARYQRQLAVLDWMHTQEQAARLAGQRGDDAPTSGSLLSQVANSAARAGVQLLRYQPESSGGISVVLQAQPFNALIEWLSDLEQRDRVRVKQISIDAQPESGLVNARINLI